MERVLENNYIFDIDCLQTIKGIGGREVLNPMKLCHVIAFFQLLELNVKTFCFSCLLGGINFDRGGHRMQHILQIF